MPEFQIGRGHDGPARVGTLLAGDLELSTPLLIDVLLKITVLPSVVMQPESHIEVKHSNDFVLLPSLIGASPLGPEFAKGLLEKQLDFLEASSEKISSSQAILRIQSSLSTDDLQEIIPRAQKLGVGAAAITYGTTRGDNDINSLRLRSLLPADWLIVALGYIHPSHIPLLFYLGIDIFDTGMADLAAAQRTRLWSMGSERIKNDQQSRFCPCKACTDYTEGFGELSSLSSELLTETLRRHNLSVYESLLSESVHAKRNGSLRWLVESMTHQSAAAVSLLRRVNTQLFDFIEEFTPTISQHEILLLGPESYNTPAVKRFRTRVYQRYMPPDEKKVVLLLPCSARKPYSDSRSHRRFNDTIDSALHGARSSIAEVILTSPLGLVPRELERMFPAAHYDIPVTGEWDAEEIAIAAAGLVAHMVKFPTAAAVVAHVSGGYLDIVKAAEGKIYQSINFTSLDAPSTSRESLQFLRKTLVHLRDVIPLERQEPYHLRDTLRATADYQFGRGAGKVLIPDNARIRGKVYGSIVCQIEKQQVCTFIGAQGAISLTLQGGERLSGLGKNWVSFEGTELKGGSLFAIGIKTADEEIRPGDEVFVLDPDGSVIGVGRSEMSGREMCELNRGRAVTLRHKRGAN
jgi:archaeosine synthase